MGRRTFNRIRTQCGLVKKERPEQQEQKEADRDTKRQRHDALLPPHFLIKRSNDSAWASLKAAGWAVSKAVGLVTV